ncbi:MAG: SprT family zinc-dependent metalloprotease [Rhodospirillaceae bacterium]
MMPAAARPRPRLLLVSGLLAPLELRESARARRMTLRLDPARGLVQVVVPAGLAEAEAVRFVGRHAGWVQARLATLPPARPFADGVHLSVLGRDHIIRHEPFHRGAGIRAGGEIRVGGRLEHLPRRVRALLIAEARSLLTERARTMAAALGARVRAVTVRDTRSRWGSCSSAGRLSFSWRLILTPEPIFNYVIAHEVAHLCEMNHSARFWAAVARLSPDATRARAWLRAHGPELLRVG